MVTRAQTVAAVGLSVAAFKAFEGHIGAALIEANGERELWAAGLKRRTAKIPDGTTMHFAERAAAAGTAPVARRDLLVLGGFTTDVAVMAPMASAFLRALPEGRDGASACWRVVLLEVPMHGRNAVPGAALEDFPDGAALEAHAFAFMDAVGLGKPSGPPLTVMGYSLGGGGACRLLAAAPHRFNSAVLVAPGFTETADAQFLARMVCTPREVHGWETKEEFVSMMTQTVCGVYPEQLAVLPGFILKGLVKQRADLGAGYFSRFATKLNESESEKTKLTDLAAMMAGCRTPVLLVVGARDNCISAEKCRRIQQQFGEEWCEMHVLDDVGHLGGPKGGNMESSLLTMSARLAADFVTAGKGAAAPQARL